MRKQKGFTLIELVVVVMILGILAAVAAPKLLGTSSSAADNGLKESLGVIRDAIERYAAEHGGSLPPATDGPTFKASLSTYIRVFPKCPIAGANADVKVVSTAGPLTGGTGAESWVFSTADGSFICNSHAMVKSQSDATVLYDTL